MATAASSGDPGARAARPEGPSKAAQALPTGAKSGSSHTVHEGQPVHRSGLSRSTRHFRLLSLLVIASGITAFAILSLDIRAPDFLESTGVVRRVATLLAQSSSTPLGTLAAYALSALVLRNPRNQGAAVEGGALDAALDLLQQKAGLRQRTSLRLLRELLRDNSDVKDAFVKKGGIAAVSELLTEDSSEALTAGAAEVLAVSAAGNNSAKKAAVKSGHSQVATVGTVTALLEYLEGSKTARSRSYVNAAWALANLAADSSGVQGLLLESGGPELVTRLLAHGARERVTQPAVIAAGNLAARNPLGQTALREAGALERLVGLISAAVEGHKSRASAPFHTEILEHVAELQRSDPAVRAALAEVGGLEELLGIIEAGAEIRVRPQSKQLVAVEEDEDGDEALHSLRRLVRDLQDEADVEGGILPDVKVPSIFGRPSGARTLPRLTIGSKQQLASSAAWALGLLIEDDTTAQDTARAAGAVEALVKLLEGAEDASVARGALGAISSLVKDNPTNKAAVRDAHGVEVLFPTHHWTLTFKGLVKLLASNPADKEVLRATANALKFMTADRPAYESLQRSSSRWLRVLSRQLAQLIAEQTGFSISPTVAGGVLVANLVAVAVMSAILALRGLTGRQAGATRSVAAGTTEAGSSQKQ